MASDKTKTKEQIPELQEVIDSLPGFVLVVGKDGTWLKNSKSAEVYARAKALHQIITDFIQEDLFKKTVEIELEITGQIIPFIVTIETLFSEAGGFVVVGHPIIEIVQMRQEIEKQRALALAAARLAGISELSAGIAHEIKNPLAIIHGRIELLRRRHKDSGPEDSFLKNMQTIVDAISRINNIVDTLSSIADPQRRMSTDFCDLNELVSKIFKLYQFKFDKHQVTVHMIQAEELRCAINISQITQAIMQLINNSLYAIKNSDKKEITLELVKEADQAALYIKDSGVGVSDSAKERLFQPFFTTKPQGEGVGLGLATSLASVNENGGQLLLIQNANPTIFKLTLPLR